MSPSDVALLGSSRKTSWNRLKFGSSGTSFMSAFARASNAAFASGPPSLRSLSMSRAMSASTLTSCAASLRVLLMLVCSSTLLREVLLSWMSYPLASTFLNCVPSYPAVPHTRVRRVGSSANSSPSMASTASRQVEDGRP